LSVQKNAGAPGSVRFRESDPASTPRISDLVNNVSALGDIRSSRGGDKLSSETATILAVLISMDPEIQTPPDFQFYVQQHGQRVIREFERGSVQGLQKSLSKCHDNLAKQVGINTRLYHQLTTAERTLGWERIWRRILTAAIVVQFGVIGWLVSEFLHRF
jgi:hypothetical protein